MIISVTHKINYSSSLLAVLRRIILNLLLFLQGLARSNTSQMLQPMRCSASVNTTRRSWWGVAPWRNGSGSLSASGTPSEAQVLAWTDSAWQCYSVWQLSSIKLVWSTTIMQLFIFQSNLINRAYTFAFPMWSHNAIFDSYCTIESVSLLWYTTIYFYYMFVNCQVLIHLVSPQCVVHGTMAVTLWTMQRGGWGPHLNFSRSSG